MQCHVILDRVGTCILSHVYVILYHVILHGLMLHRRGEENCRETADKPARENDWKSFQQKGLWLNKFAGGISISGMLIIRFWSNMLKWSQCQGNIPEKIWMIYYTNQLKTRNIIKTNKTQYISEYISAIRHITRTIWTESKIKKNVYRSDVQVTIELHGNFRFLQVFKFQIKLHLESIVLLSGFQSSPGALKSTELGSTWSISQVWRA